MIDTNTNLRLNTLQPSKKGQSIDISFRNVTYCVEVEDKTQEQSISLPCFKKYSQKVILNGVSGIFRSGELTAIMGASGCGKTTLLNVLACRLPTKHLTGSITANGQPYTFENFGDFSNYVMQQDVLIQTLTVRQTLEFAAGLKLNLSQEEKKQKIGLLARKFKLEKCLDVLIGGSLIKGISGGERKRTSIAFELISDPQVLILDQPTSGLDSLTSFIIVRYLKQLITRQGKTIFMTIHQPNADIYELLDKLILMVEGRFIYQGLASEAMYYFGNHFGLSCPQFHNPADYFMSIIHHQSPVNRQNFPMYFQTYDKQISPKIEKMIEDQHKELVIKRSVEVPFSTSLKTLVHRDYLNVIRNPLLIKMRFFQSIFIALYAGGLCYKFTGEYTSTANWHALTGYMFFISIGLTMMALIPIQLVFPLERQVFLKQEGSKLYSTFSYFLSRNLIEIPYNIFFPLLQALIMYWFVGLSSTASQFFICYLISYLITFTGVSLGLMLGSMVPDAKSVATLTPALILPLQLVAGFFKNLENIPWWIRWLQYLSPMKYGFSAFIQNQVQFATTSNIAQLNLDASLWLTIGLLAILGTLFRAMSLFFLWKLRAKLQ